MPSEASGQLTDLVEDRPTGTVMPIGVVQVAWSVDTESDQHLVLGEEARPLVIEKRAVGLDSPFNLPAGGQGLALYLECAAEEVQAH